MTEKMTVTRLDGRESLKDADGSWAGSTAGAATKNPPASNAASVFAGTPEERIADIVDIDRLETLANAPGCAKEIREAARIKRDRLAGAQQDAAIIEAAGLGDELVVESSQGFPLTEVIEEMREAGEEDFSRAAIIAWVAESYDPQNCAWNIIDADNNIVATIN